MTQWLFHTTRWAIYVRDAFACVYCEVSMAELVEARGENFLTLDHIKPKSKDGTHHPSNLVTCCYECNTAKNRSTLAAWCREMGWNYDTIRHRVTRRTGRDVECYRAAAKVLLGQAEGVPMARLVEDHDWLVKRQWDDADISGQHWDHLKSQEGMFCQFCGAPNLNPDVEGLF